MSSPPVDPRRPEKVRTYKPSANNGQSTSGGEDFLPDYMNILGMIFSMCGLMMKLKWCGKFLLNVQNEFCSSIRGFNRKFKLKPNENNQCFKKKQRSA